MADAGSLRLAFAGFLGEERFRKFVQQGLRNGRLRFWQEQEWGRFTATHPKFAVGLEELAVALGISELHGPVERAQRDAECKAIAAASAAAEATGESAFWERKSAEIRAQRCPFCGGNSVSMFCYGLPSLSDAMNAALDAKLIILGGCSFFEDDPEWVCRDCSHMWGRLFPVVTQEA